MPYHCAFTKYCIQQIAGMKSSAPTISVSIELLVLSLCLVELTMGNRHSKDRPPPKCPRILVLTVNDSSTNHFKMPLPLALNISGIVRVPMMFLIRWTNLVQSSLSGSLTLIDNNAITVQESSLGCLVT
jgi:predicted lysophospholipase L1 biosynthesis ABC-type transport system permease subunit